MSRLTSLAALVLFFSGCSSAHIKKTDITLRNFEGDYGTEVRQALESQIGKVKSFQVIARDPSSLAAVEQEAVVGKNRDDLFNKQNAGVKLGEGLAATKVIHGSCYHSKSRHPERLKPWSFPLPLIGWMLGATWKNEVTDHEFYCKYRLINAETHVQEIAGDTEPRSWTSDDDNALDPAVVRKIASEITDSIKEHLEE